MKNIWKTAILFLSVAAFLAACETSTTPNEPTPISTRKWTWVSGLDTVNQIPSYGTLGTAAASNVPGARENAVSWIDPSGKLWLFGGYAFGSDGFMGQFNDLWKFDPATSQWTWASGGNTMDQAGIYGTKGTADPANVPGARMGAVSWIDAAGNLWLFGGRGYPEVGDFGSLNDLWKFDQATLEWTWVSGGNSGNQPGTYGTLGTADPANIPGARTGAVSWIDAEGDFWLFGGNGYDSAGSKSWLNDLWKFDQATLEWTWVSGGNTGGQAGTYGTKGTADAANVPGGRYKAVSWIDSSGRLWLFGGNGFDSDASLSDLNDLWKFDPATLAWTWISGSDTGDPYGTYGTLGTAATSNYPGGRYAAVTWIDSSGDLWLFGGYGRDSANSRGWLNDLWRFRPTTAAWAWESGGDNVGQKGAYGTKGTGDLSNVPGARYFSVSWIDAQGKLWLFGGYGSDSAGDGGWLNDLWHATK